MDSTMNMTARSCEFGMRHTGGGAVCALFLNAHSIAFNVEISPIFTMLKLNLAL